MTGREFQDRQGEHWTLIRGNRQNERLAVFVHGFLGNHLNTWGRLPELLQMQADVDPTLTTWDFLFVGYTTRDVTTYLDIARILSTQLTFAAEGHPPFERKYRRFALFGHSLGTLGVRQLLCATTLHPPFLLEALHSVTLFGTPLNGSPLAIFGNWFGGAISKALEPRNAQLRMLHSWIDSVYPNHSWCDVRVVLGTDDKVVGYDHADLIKFVGDELNPRLLNLDHATLVKPKSWKASTVRDIIKGALR